MASLLPSWPYPPSREGYWGLVSSTINWCEEDYYATVYSAEVVNCLTNVLFMYLAYKGLANCYRNKHDTVFFMAYLSYLFIGVGSFLFHSTLKYPMQLLDELSMIYCSCVALYAVTSPDLPTTLRPLLLITIITLALFISAYYHFLQDPEFHQLCFAIIVAIVSFKNMYTMETQLRPKRLVTKGSTTPPYEGKTGGGEWDVKRIGSWSVEGEIGRQRPRGSVEERKREALRNMWIMVACGLGTIGVGFLVWNLDTMYCSNVRRWRRQMGLPWGVLLEGHAWWHILTGLAAYYLLTWGVYLRYCLEGRMDEVRLVWPSLWTSMPTVEKRDMLKL